MIRTSKHSLKFTNTHKYKKYIEFLAEYRRVAQIIVNDLWENGYIFNDKIFLIKEDRLDLPQFLDYKRFNISTPLSARAMRCLTTQVSSVIRGLVSKRRKTKWGCEKNNKKFNNKKYAIGKPNVLNINPELNSICADWQDGLSFYGFVRLKSLGKKYGTIKIPIKGTRVSDKWRSGRKLSSFLLTISNIIIRYELNVNKNNNRYNIVGLDTGIKKIATLSDGQKTPISDGVHTFDSILEKIARKKRGSIAFKKACSHRRNFWNWALKQLDWSNIAEVKIEKLSNLRKNKRSSKKLSHWTYAKLHKDIKRLCEEREVLVTEQDGGYMSQRCHKCGLVKKSQRKGEHYTCKNCGWAGDADYNASCNHLANLAPLSFDFKSRRENLNGFFWPDGMEATIPFSKNQKPYMVNCII